MHTNVKYLHFHLIEINKWRQYKTAAKLFGNIRYIQVNIPHIIFIHSRHKVVQSTRNLIPVKLPFLIIKTYSTPKNMKIYKKENSFFHDFFWRCTYLNFGALALALWRYKIRTYCQMLVSNKPETWWLEQKLS